MALNQSVMYVQNDVWGNNDDIVLTCINFRLSWFSLFLEFCSNSGIVSFTTPSTERAVLGLRGGSLFMPCSSGYYTVKV